MNNIGKMFLSVIAALVLILTGSHAQAEGTESIPTLAKGGEGGFFNLEIADNLINLHAEQAGFKKILTDLEKKTGIKVKIFDGVEDKKVTLNITALPDYAYVRNLFAGADFISCGALMI